MTVPSGPPFTPFVGSRECLKNYKQLDNYTELHTGRRVRILRTDKGAEYMQSSEKARYSGKRGDHDWVCRAKQDI